MIKRFLEKELKTSIKKYPIVAVTGPRQSGKTTLVKAAYPAYRYVSLEDPDTRRFAEEDPRSFLSEYDSRVIFDEIQRAPWLFSYLQTIVDRRPANGRYILTGSNQFVLNEQISQSLAGRAALLRLLPFSFAELSGRKSRADWDSAVLKTPRMTTAYNLYEILFKGLYPRIYDQQLDPHRWHRDYYETYVTKDLRRLLNVGDLKSFETFLRLLAGRSGQLLNLTSLGNDSGVSHTTAKRWLSILEASYLIFPLSPHFINFNKRLVKSPKIFFLDSGLLCYLLRINSAKELVSHPLLGGVFETFIISEFVKRFTHRGEEPPLYFWRDKSGDEIDLIIDKGKTLYPIEIKAAKTISPDFFKTIGRWLALPGNNQTGGAIVFGGDSFQKRGAIQIFPWHAVS